MPRTEHFDAVKNGVIEMAQGCGNVQAGKDPFFVLFANCTEICGDWPRTLAWLQYGGGMKLIREVYAKWDLQMISSGTYSFAGEAIVSKVPFHTLDDIKGVKVRAPERMAAVWAGVGADVLTIPGTEVYVALSTGLIDAADWMSPADNYRMGFSEVTSYYSRPGDYCFGSVLDLITNMDNWNKLPDDLKEILETAGHQLGTDIWMWTSYDDLTALSRLKEAGTEMVVWDPELTKEIKRLMAVETEKKAKASADGTRLLEALKAYAAEIQE